MKIISHRGYWTNHNEQNAIPAFQRSLQFGFGIETDLRDCNGEIVVSHDVPRPNEVLVRFSELLELYVTFEAKSFLALNVKSDELQSRLRKELESYRVENYALFDMSIPDQIKMKNSGLKYLSRMSDLETSPIGADGANGIWLDEFHTH